MKITKRTLTVEDAKFLAQLSYELNTEDTYGNASPRFFTVIDEKDETCWAENAYYWALVDEEGNEVGRVDYKVDAGELDCIPMHTRTAPVQDTLFLTHREAEEHIKANRHHYKNPFPYVQTAERSPQYERLIEVLRSVDWEQFEHETALLQELKENREKNLAELAEQGEMPRQEYLEK